MMITKQIKKRDFFEWLILSSFIFKNIKSLNLFNFIIYLWT